MYRTKSNAIYFLFLCVTIFFTYSCSEDEEDPCDSPRDGEVFTISPDALSFVSNYQNASRVVFKTALGEEVRYDISDLEGFTGEYLIGGTCDVDTSKSQTLMGTTETLYLTLSNSIEIADPLYIQLWEFPNTAIGVQEFLTVSLGPVFPVEVEGGESLFGLIINEANQVEVFNDSLEILGQKFFDVFESTDITPTPSIEIKYTEKEGIVYFKNLDTGREYVYDRIE